MPLFKYYKEEPIGMKTIALTSKMQTIPRTKGKPMTDEQADEYFESNIYPGIFASLSEGIRQSTREGIERQKRIALKQVERKKRKEEKLKKPKKLDTSTTDKEVKEAKKLYDMAISGKIDLDAPKMKQLKKLRGEKGAYGELQLAVDKFKARKIITDSMKALEEAVSQSKKEVKPKRKRRTKAEMEEYRASLGQEKPKSKSTKKKPMSTKVVVKSEPKRRTMSTKVIVKSEPKPKRVTKAQQEQEILEQRSKPEVAWKRELLGILGSISVYYRQIEKAKEEVKYTSKDAFENSKDVRDFVAQSKKAFDFGKEAMKESIDRVKELFKIGMDKGYMTKSELVGLLNKDNVGEYISKFKAMKKGKYF